MNGHDEQRRGEEDSRLKNLEVASSQLAEIRTTDQQQQQILMGINNLQQIQAVMEQIENTVNELRSLNKHKASKDLFGHETCSILCNDSFMQSRGIVEKILSESETIESLAISLAAARNNSSSRSKYKILNGSSVSNNSAQGRRRASSTTKLGDNNSIENQHNLVGLRKQQKANGKNRGNDYQSYHHCDISVNSSDNESDVDDVGDESNGSHANRYPVGVGVDGLVSNANTNNGFHSGDLCDNLLASNFVAQNFKASPLLGGNLTGFLQQQQQQQQQEQNRQLLSSYPYQQLPLFPNLIMSTTTGQALSNAAAATAAVAIQNELATIQPNLPASLTHLASLDLASQASLGLDGGNKNCDISRLFPFAAQLAAAKQRDEAILLANGLGPNGDLLNGRENGVINRTGAAMTSSLSPSSLSSSQSGMARKRSTVCIKRGYNGKDGEGGLEGQQKLSSSVAEPRADIDHQVSDSASSSGNLSDSEHQGLPAAKRRQMEVSDSNSGKRRRLLSQERAHQMSISQRQHQANQQQFSNSPIRQKGLQEQQTTASNSSPANQSGKLSAPYSNSGNGYTIGQQAQLQAQPQIHPLFSEAATLFGACGSSAAQQQQQQQQQQRQAQQYQTHQLSPQHQKSFESILGASRQSLGAIGGPTSAAMEAHAQYQQAMLLQQHLFLSQLAMSGRTNAAQQINGAAATQQQQSVAVASAANSHAPNPFNIHSDLLLQNNKLNNHHHSGATSPPALMAAQQQQQQQSAPGLSQYPLMNPTTASPLDPLMLARGLAGSLNGGAGSGSGGLAQNGALFPSLEQASLNGKRNTQNSNVMAAYEQSVRQQQQQQQRQQQQQGAANNVGLNSMISQQNQVAAMNFIHHAAQQHLQLRLAAAAAAAAAASNSGGASTMSATSSSSPGSSSITPSGPVVAAPARARSSAGVPNEEVYLF